MLSPFHAVGKVAPVASAQVADSPFGLGFEKLDRAVFNPEPAYDLIGATGVKWIRIQSGWARTEKERGVYDFTWLDSIADNLIARGLRPWISLGFGNPLYDEEAAKWFGAVGCPPIHTPEQREAWCRYVTALTGHFRDRVEYYEIWNEPEGKGFWKCGVNPAQYADLIMLTAPAIRKGFPEAKIMGGGLRARETDLLTFADQVFRTDAVKMIDALTYHGYDIAEADISDKLHALRALVHSYNPAVELIQGEAGAQSRQDGCGALRQMQWTEERQARFLARHLMKHLLDGVKFTSYFTSVDMVEAIHGQVGDLASRMDFGYFGVLGADFDAEGIATGNYTPKQSYRALQTLAAIFHGKWSLTELPIFFLRTEVSPLRRRLDDSSEGLYTGGFRRDNGSAAFVYWKPTDLLAETYQSSVSLEFAHLPAPVKLIRLKTGEVLGIPPEWDTEGAPGVKRLLHLPLLDEPMLLTFGDFIPSVK